MHGRILIVDDTATNRIVYKVRLGEAFYEPVLATDGAGCLRMAREAKPDLILLDMSLSDMPGTEVLRELRANPLTRRIPLIALAASDSTEERLAALEAGADDVMSKPLDDAVLMARVRNLLRMRDEARFVTQAWGTEAPEMLGMAEAAEGFEAAGTIGLIAASPATALGWKQKLQHQMRDQMVLMTRDQALALPPSPNPATPEVFVIEADLENVGAGLRLMSDLGSHAGTRHSAVCIVSADDDGPGTVMAFDLGADDVVDRSVVAQELGLRLRALLRRKRQADRIRATVEDGLRLAMVDPLTGVHNRRYAMPRLAGIAAQAASEGSDFAVMVVDLDRFKQVNDRFGHAAGDAVLIEVARRLAENLRMSDLLARIGGEEFLVALPQTGLADAERVAERLRQVIAETPVTLPSGEKLRVTVSIGVALGGEAGTGAEAVSGMVDRADRALLASKTAGRNLVTFSSRSAA